MRGLFRSLGVALALACAPAAAPALAAHGAQPVPPPPLVLDHAWIAVRPGAPERRALERAGFHVNPFVNRHGGQGAASITVEFENGFLELLWPDDSVMTAPDLAAAKGRFVARSHWRENDWSPFGVGFRRTATSPAAFPFETWKVGGDGMGAGQTLEMLTPRASHGVSLFVPAQAVDEAANLALIHAGGPRAAVFHHPNGARRLTALRVIAPAASALPPAAEYIRTVGAAGLDEGRTWMMEVTLDHAAQRKTADLRPDLPLMIHY
ncbi:MAG: VOC family protein [Proteobacteria bacterium]|nr:VOC family protein [Pseudomonadota bacterium]